MSVQTADGLLTQLRALVNSPMPYTHKDADAFALLFEWMDDKIMAGQFPTDYLIAFSRKDATLRAEKRRQAQLDTPSASVVGS